MVATVFIGKRPPTSAAAPRARLSRRCPCVGRCTFGNGSRTRGGCKARNHPWAWEGAGPLADALPSRTRGSPRYTRAGVA